MRWRGAAWAWAWVLVVVWAVGVESNSNGGSNSNDESASKSKGHERLMEIQTELLDMVGNHSSSASTINEGVRLLHTAMGKKLGKLLAEALLLGFEEKDSMGMLSKFWIDMQERLSPRLVKQVNDYYIFVRTIDFRTLPLIWEQMLKEDNLGNSLAKLPLGQLIDMVQPTASKYGVDIRAFVNSLMGKGDNNARDLFIKAIDNFEWSRFYASFLNNTSTGNIVAALMSGQASEVDFIFAALGNFLNLAPESSKTKGGILRPMEPKMNPTEPQMNPETKPTEPKLHPTDPKLEETKRNKNEKTLRLFRPLVTSILRENKIDLDADAVLEVLSPLLAGDFLGNMLPLLSPFGGQGSRGGQKQGDMMAQLLPLLSAFGGPGRKDGKQGEGNMMAQLLPLLSAFGGPGSKDGKQKRGDMMSQLLPLMSAFGGPGSKDRKQGEGNMMAQLLPLMSAFGGLGSKDGRQKQGEGTMASQMSNLLSAIGTQARKVDKQEDDDSRTDFDFLPNANERQMRRERQQVQEGEQRGSTNRQKLKEEMNSFVNDFEQELKRKKQEGEYKVDLDSFLDIYEQLLEKRDQIRKEKEEQEGEQEGSTNQQEEETWSQYEEEVLDQLVALTKPEVKDKEKDERKQQSLVYDLIGQLVFGESSQIAILMNYFMPVSCPVTQMMVEEGKKRRVNQEESEKPLDPETVNQIEGMTQRIKSRLRVRPRQIFDILEPIIITLQEDKKCFNAVKSFAKRLEIANANLPSNIFNREQLVMTVKALLMHELLSGLNLDAEYLIDTLLAGKLEELGMYIMQNLERTENQGQDIIVGVMEAVAKYIKKATSRKDEVYERLKPGFETYLAETGNAGLTFDNFPVHFTPTAIKVTHRLNLPFNATVLLGPLRNYLESSVKWFNEKIDEVGNMSERDIQRMLFNQFMGLTSGYGAIAWATDDGRLRCLKERICYIAGTDIMTESGATVMRYGCFYKAALPQLESPNCFKLLRIVKAILASYESCERYLPYECRPENLAAGDDDDSEETRMNLDYDHTEL